LISTGYRVSVKPIEMKIIQAGSSYSFPPFVFHATAHLGLTATVLTKNKKTPLDPRVLVAYGHFPDNDFDREAFDPEDLWPFVERALLAAKSFVVQQPVSLLHHIT
jgi:hypothetical protein